MSEDIARQKRNAATGLTVKPLSVKPFEDDEKDPIIEDPARPVKTEKPPVSNAGGVLPVITKPKTRPHSVSGRVSDGVAGALNELSKLTGRSQSYLISEMLEHNLEAWVAQQKDMLTNH